MEALSPGPCPKCKETNYVTLNYRTSEDPPFSLRCYHCGYQTEWFNSVNDVIDNWSKECLE